MSGTTFVRAEDRAMPAEQRILRFPHLLGGDVRMRALGAEERLAYLESDRTVPGVRDRRRFVGFAPASLARDEEFFVTLDTKGFGERGGSLAFVQLEARLPSGRTHRLAFLPEHVEERQGVLIVPGFRSQAAGTVYVSARLIFADGSTCSDAGTARVLSRNPDQLTLTPRVWLVSGTAGRVEYDWDSDEFHCRAYGEVTNGSSVARTYKRCAVRVWDGGVGGDLIAAFSFAAGPFSVPPGGTAQRVIDTWYARGGDVWDKFNRRWDLTLECTYEAVDGTRVSDSAAYRPMSTVPLNLIKATDFSDAQNTALADALQVAAEILEERDITLANPNRRIISDPNNRARFGTIDIGWSGGDYDFDEAQDMYEEISGPDGDRLDVYVPLSFNYLSSVPADKRNVGGFSTINGPFPKDDDPRRSGSLVLMSESDHEFFGVAIAHEVCHYLGLDHVDAEDNLMHKNGGLTDHNLTRDQWNGAKQHGMMKWLAPDI